MLHKCEHTVPSWRPYAVGWAMLNILSVAINLYLGALLNLVVGTLAALTALWCIISWWLGHPWLPKKWLKAEERRR